MRLACGGARWATWKPGSAVLAAPAGFPSRRLCFGALRRKRVTGTPRIEEGRRENPAEGLAMTCSSSSSSRCCSSRGVLGVHCCFLTLILSPSTNTNRSHFQCIHITFRLNTHCCVLVFGFSSLHVRSNALIHIFIRYSFQCRRLIEGEMEERCTVVEARGQREALKTVQHLQ